MDEEVYDQVLKYEDELYKEEEAWESAAESQISDSQDLLLSHVYYNSKLAAPDIAQSNNKSSGSPLFTTPQTSLKEGERLMTSKPKNNNKQQYDSSTSTYYSRDRKGKNKVDVDEVRTPPSYTTARDERFMTPEPRYNHDKDNDAYYDSTPTRAKGSNKVDANKFCTPPKQIRGNTYLEAIVISDDDIETSSAYTIPYNSNVSSTSTKAPETDSKYTIGRTKIKNSKASPSTLGSKKRIQLGNTSDSYSSSDTEYKLSIKKQPESLPISVHSTPSKDPANSTTTTAFATDNTTNMPEGIFVKEIITPVATPSRFMQPNCEYNLPERSPSARRNTNKASNSNHRYFDLPPQPSPVCYDCGGHGHYGDDCPGKMRGRGRRNHASTSSRLYDQDDRSRRRRRYRDDYDRYEPHLYYSDDEYSDSYDRRLYHC
ncbi:13692_t:CDS:2 [Ambispora leptoticha]|uniref:13692_t:CDS:1 n=1 Tax=Ambispora leptoticha TaxID=144679 RepID=A0A9N8W718_9GLOM|nr:13692_t:CDS:2 [Ambispora leptoticha]